MFVITREMEDARARLEAFRDKVQPYPPYPEEIEEVLPEPEWTGRQWDKVQQLRSEVEGWRQKHAEALLAIDKLTKKKSYLYE